MWDWAKNADQIWGSYERLVSGEERRGPIRQTVAILTNDTAAPQEQTQLRKKLYLLRPSNQDQDPNLLKYSSKLISCSAKNVTWLN